MGIMIDDILWKDILWELFSICGWLMDLIDIQGIGRVDSDGVCRRFRGRIYPPLAGILCLELRALLDLAL